MPNGNYILKEFPKKYNNISIVTLPNSMYKVNNDGTISIDEFEKVAIELGLIDIMVVYSKSTR